MPDIIDKKSLRSLMRRKRKELSPKTRIEFSMLASRFLIEDEAWQNARTVAIYMAMSDEMDTSFLIEAAWINNKVVLLPLCSETIPGHMDFIRCDSYEELKPGPFGILEPRHDKKSQNLIVPDIFIVPGVAFDSTGKRLGMGGGYYDRIFAKREFMSCPRIGFAFEFQIVADLPAKEWDQTVDALCTEKGMLWIKRS